MPRQHQETAWNRFELPAGQGKEGDIESHLASGAVQRDVSVRDQTSDGQRQQSMKVDQEQVLETQDRHGVFQRPGTSLSKTDSRRGSSRRSRSPSRRSTSPARGSNRPPRSNGMSSDVGRMSPWSVYESENFTPLPQRVGSAQELD